MYRQKIGYKDSVIFLLIHSFYLSVSYWQNIFYSSNKPQLQLTKKIKGFVQRFANNHIGEKT